MSTLAKLLRSAASQYIPTVIGESYGGGYYAGNLRGDDGILYAIVVAPTAAGQDPLGDALVNSGITIPYPLSDWDGRANMAVFQGLGIANFPSPLFCANLSIGGFTDWHLPAMDQLNLLYRSFKPNASGNVANTGANPHMEPPKGIFTSTDPAYTTAIDLFGAGSPEQFLTTNFYLSSTVDSSTTTKILNFSQGQTTVSSITAFQRVTRAVRMVKLPG